MDVNGIRAGQRVRVTSLQAARGWHGRALVTVPAGAQVEGVVHDLTADGFFELWLDSGELRSFSAHDRSIAVEPVATAARDDRDGVPQLREHGHRPPTRRSQR